MLEVIRKITPREEHMGSNVNKPGLNLSLHQTQQETRRQTKTRLHCELKKVQFLLCVIAVVFFVCV